MEAYSEIVQAMQRLTAVALALLTLAACGKGAGQDQAPDATSRPAAGAASSGLPSDVPLYPGARVITVIRADSGNQVMAATSDSIEKVAAFYANDLASKGWKRDRSWYTRPDFLVFTKDRRQARITLKPGAPAGAETMLSITLDNLDEKSGAR